MPNLAKRQLTVSESRRVVRRSYAACAYSMVATHGGGVGLFGLSMKERKIELVETRYPELLARTLRHQKSSSFRNYKQ